MKMSLDRAMAVVGRGAQMVHDGALEDAKDGIEHANEKQKDAKSRMKKLRAESKGIAERAKDNSGWFDKLTNPLTRKGANIAKDRAKNAQAQKATNQRDAQVDEQLADLRSTVQDVEGRYGESRETFDALGRELDRIRQAAFAE